MTAGAVVFMALSWSFVLGLLLWTYRRILRKPRPGEHHGPDGAAPSPGAGSRRGS